MYLTVGNGGNLEGASRSWVDTHPPPYCSDPAQFQVPNYQPSPSGKVGAAACLQLF